MWIVCLSLWRVLGMQSFVAMREAHRVAAAAVWTTEQVEALLSTQPETLSQGGQVRQDT